MTIPVNEDEGNGSSGNEADTLTQLIPQAINRSMNLEGVARCMHVVRGESVLFST